MRRHPECVVNDGGDGGKDKQIAASRYAAVGARLRACVPTRHQATKNKKCI